MSCSSGTVLSVCASLSSPLPPSRTPNSNSNLLSFSWLSSFPSLTLSASRSAKNPSNPSRSQDSFIRAAYTRRSRGEAAKKPSRKSWKQRTDMYMRPFLLNVFFSKRFIHAKVVHRGTSKVICVATTNAKDLRNSLPSLIDHDACRVVGRLIAERSMEADVFAVAYEPRKDERIEGRLGIVLDTIKENGIIFI
ncbi:50S ribosomal protein L18 [Vigna umbellata]|uniref:50S ribosomal protein L18 n=1 Tax=Vigna umbellata TaxID=87088 RepID=UPI001F5E608D|nr:50S ribosomal protein L18 [Vigna umbellata]